ncbi:DNA-directed DNA polymerase [Caerostris extrusa]|uniref:DNA-directed DNA polymerase n=1 Tax=Caerostris extrusa TaxID=172846 RepID=A0AAV4XX95_CAEEX|nr:DNA-directed DNA polymerase [Caerostris extrusa]
MTPDAYSNGGLIMSILHPSLKIRIIDSLNFPAHASVQDPDCFGFKESDVDILRRCCLEFRGQFQEITQVDPFLQYVTIASLHVAVFRSYMSHPNTIAMVPIHGYIILSDTSPKDSIRWLDFVSHNENIVILHALMVLKDVSNHGCPICYDPDSVHPL